MTLPHPLADPPGRFRWIVFSGDIQQIDQPYLDALSNGLTYLINRMTGQPIYAHVTLEKGERSPLADLASALL
jgi:PhoH-like ATPase